MGDDKRTDDKTKAKDAAATPAGEPAGAGEATSNVAPFAATGRGKPCPICGRPSIVEMRPFCSKRCADIDLGRWLGEVYRIPTADRPSSDDELPAPKDKPDEP